MQIGKERIYFSLALIFAIWFALTASAWTYLANLVISLPFGILSLVFWRKGKAMGINVSGYRYIPIILITGLIISFTVLVYLLLFN